MFSCAITKSSKEVVADPTWMGAVSNNSMVVYVPDYFVVDNMVYMGTVNNSSNTWHVLMCV